MLNVTDGFRLRRALGAVRELRTREALAAVLPGSSNTLLIDSLMTSLTFDHGGLAVFPDTVDEVAQFLSANNVAGIKITPSVVVRERISSRYGLDPAGLEVWIVRGLVETGLGWREIEVFAVPCSEEIADPERAEENETHLAFRMRGASAAALDDIWTTLRYGGRMLPDGGGYNPYDTSLSPEGCSVLYLSRSHAPDDQLWVRRMELTCAGRHPTLESHISSPSLLGRIPRQM